MKWDNGGDVWVNRGPEDWTIPCGHTLPQYGFYARAGSTEAAIEWTGDKVAWKALTAAPNPFLSRFNLKNQPINFGPLTTTGALRLTRQGTTTLLTPLPGGAAFEIRLTQTGQTIQRDPKEFNYRLTN